MIEFVYTDTDRSCCHNFTLSLDKRYTVEELINWILLNKKGDHGSIKLYDDIYVSPLPQTECTYSDGHLDCDFEDSWMAVIRDCIVMSATLSDCGGIVEDYVIHFR